MDQFIGIVAMMASAIFFFLAASLRERNAKFNNAKAVEGRIIELHPAAGGNSQYPVVEYVHLGESKTFKNNMTIQGAEVGQLLLVQIAGDGSVRVDAAGNYVVPVIMTFLSVAGFSFGLIMIMKGGF